MRNRFLLLLLIGLLIAILIVLAKNAEGTVGPLSTTDFGSLTYKIAAVGVPRQRRADDVS